MDNWVKRDAVGADQEVIEEIAQECGRSVEEVHNVYVAVRGKLESNARVKDYVPVLVNRRVRNLLHVSAAPSG